jgi:hypothetical protein
MAVMITRRRFNCALLPGILSLGSQAPGQRHDGSHIWDPDRITWQPDDPPGAKYALLDGDRDRPGTLFSYAFWLPGGVWAPAHYHSQDAHVCVVRGTLKLGFGSRLDKTRAVAVPTGHFFIARAGEPHFEGSDGECLIIGTALGGWRTTVVE